MKFVPKELRETADISRGSTSWRSHLKGAVSIGVILIVLYFLLGLAADLLASYIPDRWETYLFSSSPEPEKKKTPDFRRAEAVFRPLLQNPGLRSLPYQLSVLDLSMPNAVAVPGGHVQVSPALLKAINAETGLAMVLAHELGHHQGRHSLKRLGRGLMYGMAMALLFGDAGSSPLGLSLVAAESSYSRKQEREADEFGLKLVYETYGHTREALEFFETIHREYKSDTSRWSSFFASHPYTPDRIAHLRELQKSLPEKRAPRPSARN